MTAELQEQLPFKVVLIIGVAVVLIALCSIGATLLFAGKIAFPGTRPTDIGVQSGQLAPCPNTPNCVNSQSQAAQSQIEPLTYNTTPVNAIADLKKVIGGMERTSIVTETQNYLYAEFTSKLMGFVDDVEFLVDDHAKVIHVRSASRLGKSDLGVNRQRVEAIRAKLNELKTKV